MKISEIKKYKGQVGLDVNLDELRDRDITESSQKEFKKKALSTFESKQKYNRATSVCRR